MTVNKSASGYGDPKFKKKARSSAAKSKGKLPTARKKTATIERGRKTDYVSKRRGKKQDRLQEETQEDDEEEEEEEQSQHDDDVEEEEQELVEEDNNEDDPAYSVDDASSVSSEDNDHDDKVISVKEAAEVTGNNPDLVAITKKQYWGMESTIKKIPTLRREIKAANKVIKQERADSKAAINKLEDLLADVTSKLKYTTLEYAKLEQQLGDANQALRKSGKATKNTKNKELVNRINRTVKDYLFRTWKFIEGT